jgi:hypothetical protein
MSMGNEPYTTKYFRRPPVYCRNRAKFSSWHEACGSIIARKNKYGSFGILEVRLPKPEAARSKEIKVAVEEGPTTSVGQN